MPPERERQASGRPDAEAYAALVRAAASGDAAAMERLLLTAQDVAWRFSTTVCGGGDDAEDVMQDALLTTYRRLDRIRRPEAFRAWLYRTVRNACLMRRRTRVDEPKRLLSIDDPQPSKTGQSVEVADPSRTPEDLAMNARLRRSLQRAIASLPPPFRVVVFLRDVEGLSTREVARILETSEANVKQRLHRARLHLRKKLADS